MRPTNTYGIFISTNIDLNMATVRNFEVTADNFNIKKMSVSGKFFPPKSRHSYC